MHYRDLQKLIETLYAPALALRAWMPYDTRARVRHVLSFVSAVTFVLALLGFALQHTLSETLPFLTIVDTLDERILGVFFIVFSAAFSMSALEAMHRSYYYHGLATIIGEYATESGVGVSWEVATIVSDTQDHDITGGFLESELGQQVLYRAGVTSDAFEEFIQHRTPTLVADAYMLDRDGGVTLPTYLQSIYKQDEAFRDLLAKEGITKEALFQAAHWVMGIEQAQRARERWWSRDNLGRMAGFGKTWSYGETYLLERYGHDLILDPLWHATAFRVRNENDEVEAMEATLARARQSNVIIVASDPSSARESALLLYRKIRSGRILPPLEGRRMFLVNVEAIVTTNSDKASFEDAFCATLNQAVEAGNIILYFENLSVAIASAAAFQVDLVDLMTPYFEADTIQIIIGTEKHAFHRTLSHDTRIMHACDVVQTHTVDEDALRSLMEQRAYARELTTGVVCTIPALQAIMRLADRYFPGGTMPDKAFDLLEEIIPYALRYGKMQVRAELVEHLVEQKTNVPVGTPSKEESEKLLSLETVLHARVVGQDVAVNAISRALRRARTGITNPNKPMGSFLFLGPTGVGKTEMAKALAQTLFGHEREMNRLDMSEFQGGDALEELIGSFETGVPGRLTTMIRDHQYGVLLLDELEKSSHVVHDLLLQVLDEGKFTDAGGEDVNARNLVIIATSNAGADLIWEWSRDGVDIVSKKRDLVDHLIKAGLYRPELLNRFDDIVVFHPLGKEHMQEIARIHLTRLAGRLLQEKNIALEVTDALIARVAEKGYDPQFGGRALTRAIQEEVEQVVADSILRDTLHTGDTVTYGGATTGGPTR
ncbi:MAG: ATP-dependent Clp protease ATP-binding subunit [Candidatus Pacebacteria bacterium]|nr:ATP-dependent Clp protease ATP-binding subunit [Candidatus Paceibacterota bacterium]